MTDRPRSFIRHRSHSCREKPSYSDLHRQKINRIERDFERELAKSNHELQWAKLQRRDTFSTPTEHLENIRMKLKTGYNQLMRQKVEAVEENLNQRYEEERRLSQRKFRKAQIANEKLRLRSMNEIVRERDAICEEKLAAQRRFYDHLLDEQARRLQFEKTLQSFENLNIDQLKDRLTHVEHSNQELKQLIGHLINRQPLYQTAIYIPRRTS